LLKEAEARIHELNDALKRRIVKRGRIEVFNPAAGRNFGYTTAGSRAAEGNAAEIVACSIVRPQRRMAASMPVLLPFR